MEPDPSEDAAAPSDAPMNADEAHTIDPLPNVDNGGRPALPPLRAATDIHGLASELQLKVNEVLTACRSKDITALKALTISQGGLAADQARRAAWPLLLGCETHEHEADAWRDRERHRDEDQVALDVNRSFVYYPRNESDKRIQQRKEELSDTITHILRRNPYLCYFQGYHDIVQVFLLVLGAEHAVPAIERLSVLRIRDFMLPTMTGALSHLSLLPAVLHAADPELHQHLSHTAPFYFALSATLTLYAHEIQEYGDIARLFDFILAHESVVSLYLFAIIICSRKKQLMELDSTEHDMLHSILSKLPSPLNLDDLITRTAELFRRHPPEKLGGFAWFWISTYSVLKTTRSLKDLHKQSLADGKVFFEEHAAEISRQESRNSQLLQARHLALQYRRPAIMTGTAIAVALLALYLRKFGSTYLLEWGSKSLLKAQRGGQR